MADENVAKLDKLTFNNFIVGLRGAVRQSVVHIIHKLTRDASQLKNKKTINEQQKAKNIRRADKYIEEIKFLKSQHADDLGKFAVLCTKSFKTVGDNPKSSIEERVLCRVSEHKSIQPIIIKFRKDFPNWSTEVSNIIKGLGVNFRKKRLERWAVKGKLDVMVEKERKFFLLLHELFGMDLDPKMLKKGPVKLKKKKEENNNTKAPKTLSENKLKKNIKTINDKCMEKELSNSDDDGEKMDSQEEDLNNVGTSKFITKVKLNKDLDFNESEVDEFEGKEEEEIEGESEDNEEESGDDKEESEDVYEDSKEDEEESEDSEEDEEESEDDEEEREEYESNKNQEDTSNKMHKGILNDAKNINSEEDGFNKKEEKELNKKEKSLKLKESRHVGLGLDQKFNKIKGEKNLKKMKNNKKKVENILPIKSKKGINPIGESMSEIESIFSPFDEQNVKRGKKLVETDKIKLDKKKSSKPVIKSFVKGTCKVKQLDLTNISEDLLFTTNDPMNEEESSDDEDSLKTNLTGNKSSFFLGRKEVDEDNVEEDQEMDDNKNIDKDNRKRKFKMVRNSGDDESTKFFKKSLYRGESDLKSKNPDEGTQKTYTDGLNRFERRRQQFGPVERQGRKRTFGRGRHSVYNDSRTSENLEGGDIEHQNLSQRGRGRGRGRSRGDFNNAGFISRSNTLPLGNKVQSSDKKIVKESLLHPSWAAKKKQTEESSSINSFQGKRITFDD